MSEPNPINECGSILWKDVQDGDYLELRQEDADGNTTDTILMTRDVARDLAQEIMRNF